MSEFLGARISLISKSDIRYSGVLHQINSEESTVSLENVISYGTEGRRGKPEEEIPPADQIYEYIVFRGNDVKDLRIEEGPSSKEAKPPSVPNDPAIVGARSRPMNINVPPHFPQGMLPQGAPGFPPNMPPPGAWGGLGGPPPRNFPYPPPNGWYPPQGMSFGANGPDPWNNYYNPGMPPPYGPGPAGPGGPVGPGGLNNGRMPPQSLQTQQPVQPPQLADVAESRPAPIGAGVEKQKGPASGPVGGDAKPAGQAAQPKNNNGIPTGPRGARPNNEVKKPETSASAPRSGPADAMNTSAPAPVPVPAVALPTGPKTGTRITPIIPLPAGLVNKAQAQAAAKPSGESTVNATALRDATQAAKAAVAVAMAKLEGSGVTAAPTAGSTSQTGASAPDMFANGGTAMDNLTRKVNEMRVNANNRQSSGGGGRGRGRGGGMGARTAAKTVPLDADFDFMSANAKFSKVDMTKESAAVDTTDATDTSDAVSSPAPAAATMESSGVEAPVAYNKTKSFFDNISSEAKERAEKGGQKAGGREWRGEEQRRNIETFGQGSVDGGYRGYRGRGRGRGRGGFNRGRGGGGGGGGYRRNNHEQQQGIAS